MKVALSLKRDIQARKATEMQNTMVQEGFRCSEQGNRSSNPQALYPRAPGAFHLWGLTPGASVLSDPCLDDLNNVDRVYGL